MRACVCVFLYLFVLFFSLLCVFLESALGWCSVLFFFINGLVNANKIHALVSSVTDQRHKEREGGGGTSLKEVSQRVTQKEYQR